MTGLAVTLAAALVVCLALLLHARSALADARAALAAPRPTEPRAAASIPPGFPILRAIGDDAPVAMVVYSEDGQLAYTNREARALFFEDQAPPEGTGFLALLDQGPEALRRAVVGERDELFTVEEAGERELYWVGKRHVKEDSGHTYTLVMVKRLTQELGRQELEAWKRIIRVMAHEIGNSLAPVSSLVHSARVLTKGKDESGKLERIFETIAERAEHLRSFLERYATLARLPEPHRREVDLAGFLGKIGGMFPHVRVEVGAGGSVFVDPAQLEQVLLNLLKNAAEAGGDPEAIELFGEVRADGTARIVVRDRGQGLSSEVMGSAFVPFYSTKEKGSGLGLPLCREIVEAHGGRLRLQNREGGGAEIVVRLPARDTTGDDFRVKLTLTRG